MDLGNLNGRITLDSAQFQAGIQQAISGLKQLEQSVKGSGSGMRSINNEVKSSGGLMRGFAKNIGVATAQMVGFSLAAGGVVGALMGIKKLFSDSISSIDRYQSQSVEMAAMITSLQAANAKGAFDAGKAYKQNLAYARETVDALQTIDAETAAGAEDLAIMTRQMAMQGVLLDTNNAKQVASFKNIANALAAVTASAPNKAIQYGTETRALFSGETIANADLAKVVDGLLHGKLKENLKIWKEQGTAIENIGKALVGFQAATGDIGALWSTIKSTTETIYNQVLRGGMTPFFETAVSALQTMNDFLKEHKTTIQEGIYKTWLAVEGVFVTIWNLLEPYGPIFELLGKLTLMILDGWGRLCAVVLPEVGKWLGNCTKMAVNLVMAGGAFGAAMLTGITIVGRAVVQLGKAIFAAITGNFQGASDAMKDIVGRSLKGMLEAEVGVLKKSIGNIKDAASYSVSEGLDRMAVANAKYDQKMSKKKTIAPFPTGLGTGDDDDKKKKKGKSKDKEQTEYENAMKAIDDATFDIGQTMKKTIGDSYTEALQRGQQEWEKLGERIKEAKAKHADVAAAYNALQGEFKKKAIKEWTDTQLDNLNKGLSEAQGELTQVQLEMKGPLDQALAEMNAKFAELVTHLGDIGTRGEEARKKLQQIADTKVKTQMTRDMNSVNKFIEDSNFQTDREMSTIGAVLNARKSNQLTPLLSGQREQVRQDAKSQFLSSNRDQIKNFSRIAGDTSGLISQSEIQAANQALDQIKLKMQAFENKQIKLFDLQQIEKEKEAITEMIDPLTNVRDVMGEMQSALGDTLATFAQTGEFDFSGMVRGLTKSLQLMAAQKTAAFVMEALYCEMMSLIKSMNYMTEWEVPFWNAAAVEAWTGAAIMGSFVAGSALGAMAHNGITDVPEDGTWLLQKGERVVDSKTNQDLKGYLKGGGGSNTNNVNVTINGGDEASIMKALPKLKKTIIEAVNQDIAGGGQTIKTIRKYA